jgi:hypothetical protein
VQRTAGDVVARPVLLSNQTRLGIIDDVTADFATAGKLTGRSAVGLCCARWLPASPQRWRWLGPA